MTTATATRPETEQRTSLATVLELIHRLGPEFRRRSEDHDKTDSFVAQNYAELREHRIFAAAIPEELGGGGLSHGEMCEVLNAIAHYCGSTGLALSMHQHLLAANIWKYRKGLGAEEMLRKVARDQPILVSTGAKDWLESNGEMKKVDGGYHYSGSKSFASQSAIGNILITSGPYNDPQSGWQVFHFPVPFTSPGVSVVNDWYTMGMRGTGSHTVKLENVFIPESAIVLRRPRGEFHSFFNVVCLVALPLIMSVYVGLAQRAHEIALGVARKRGGGSHLPYLVGEMNNLLTAAEVQWKDMIRIANNFDFEPLNLNGHEAVTRKTNVAEACIGTVTKAMEVVGGQGYYRTLGLERLFRDVQGARYHPMQEMEQLMFSGNLLLQST